MADKVRGLLGSLKVLQDEQVQKAQTQADAGRHPLQGPRLRRHLRAAGAADRDRRDRRSSSSIVLDWFPDWGPMKRYGLVAGALILAYKAPDIWLKNKIDKRTTRDPQGPARRARPARDLRRGRPHRRRRLRPRRPRAGPRLSRARRRIRPDLDRAWLPHRPPLGLRESRQAHRSRIDPRRRHDDDPDREIRHPAGLAPCASSPPNSATSG